MGAMKRFAEEVSEEMGYDGDLNNKVFEEAQRRLHGETILLIIDPQMDFCDPSGTLSVPGAWSDMVRLSNFITENKNLFDTIVISLDSHSIYQPFHPDFWTAGNSPSVNGAGILYSAGAHPEPFTVITRDDVLKGVWVPLCNEYIMPMFYQLEDSGQILTIWPPHCLVGTTGHNIHPSITKAINEHCRYWKRDYTIVLKGQSKHAEHYGILYAEAYFEDDSLTHVNTDLVSRLLIARRIYIAGEAKSHCILATIKQMLSHGCDPSSICVLTDCMSSVPDIQLPNGNKIECDKMTEVAFSEFRLKGMKFTTSAEAWVYGPSSAEAWVYGPR